MDERGDLAVRDGLLPVGSQSEPARGEHVADLALELESLGLLRRVEVDVQDGAGHAGIVPHRVVSFLDDELAVRVTVEGARRPVLADHHGVVHHDLVAASVEAVDQRGVPRFAESQSVGIEQERVLAVERGELGEHVVHRRNRCRVGARTRVLVVDRQVEDCEQDRGGSERAGQLRGVQS